MRYPVVVVSTETRSAAPFKAAWWSRAACRFADPELFFPVSADGPSAVQIAEAKAVCARCQVRRECLSYALSNREQHGVWGGTSPEERQKLKRRARGRGLHDVALVS